MAIDRTKGIVCKPMPKYWYDRHAANKIEDREQRSLCHAILADKKPYFMTYIYPALMREYNTYKANTNRKSLREFRISVEELLKKDEASLTEEERQFIHYYKLKMPVGIHDCLMNRICRKFEEQFDGYIVRHSSDYEFDYNILKSGQEYTSAQYRAVTALFEEYSERVQSFRQCAKNRRMDEDESAVARLTMAADFRNRCFEVCSNGKQLCDIILDICYTREGSKQFAWDIMGEEIIGNLLRNNGYNIRVPVQDSDGDTAFGGERFSFKTIHIENEEDADADRSE